MKHGRRLLFCIAILVFCDKSYSDVRQLDSEAHHWAAGIPTDLVNTTMRPTFEGQQRRTNWCWAASAQMVLNFHNIAVTQEQIVARIFGGALPNVTAKKEFILASLNGWGVDSSGRRKSIVATDLSDLSIRDLVFELISSLKINKPVIVGGYLSDKPTGHIYVLTGVEYYFPKKNSPEFNNGDPIIKRVILRDPWPSSGSKIVLSGKEFINRFDLAVSVSIDP